MIFGSLLLTGALAQTYSIPADTPAHIRRAVESDSRPAEDRARDAGRRPAEVLTLSGIAPGDHVIELGSFGNYYTRMLIDAVGPDGRVDMIDLPRFEQFGAEGSRALVDMYSNASYSLADYATAEFPQGVDVVFVVLHYHDLQPAGVDMANLNEKLFAALAPGGRYVVVDHKAEDGSGWRDAESVHRVGAQVIVEEVTAAGFELAIDSDLLANPADDHSSAIFAPGTRGQTDRALFVFRKPE
ncbi:MAG TPA: methyltransferase [Gammaproteobacteria bacterium]|nr:methyltransferase [Gammaproteobacteria bacterium]